MNIKIVTDSSCDLPQSILQDLDIQMIPLYITFNLETYKDRFELSIEDFYTRLVSSTEVPKTSQPTIEDFKKVYEDLSKTADAIISIHLSSTLSGTYNAALQAKQQMQTSCPIEIIDSRQASLGLGLIVCKLARAVRENRSLSELIELANASVRNTVCYCLFDTLEYLVKGGRIGKAKGLLGALINIKPVLIVKEGEVLEYTKVRSFARGLETLKEIVMQNLPLSDIMLAGTANPQALADLAKDIKANINWPADILTSQFGATIGTHAGPGAIGVAFIRA